MGGSDSHWRSQSAREYARPWASTKREVVSGVCIGILGTVGSIIVTNLNPWFLVLIAVAAVILGAFAPWTVALMVGLATATGRDLRSRLGAIEEGLSQLVLRNVGSSDAGNTQSMRPEREPLSEGVQRLVGLFSTGQLISQRCQQGFKSFQGDPPRLIEDIEHWKANVVEALSQWPNLRDQFAGDVTHNDSFFWSTQEIEIRMKLLMTILEILVPERFVEG
jgi:hypothetical protein